MLFLAHAGLPLLAPLWLRRMGSRWGSIPLAWVSVGGVLPDLIDKPIGYLVLDYGIGRLWGHTLLLVVVLAVLAAALWGRAGMARSAPLVALTFGTFTHLILDAMWRLPDTFLWPLLGEMPRGDAALADSLWGYADAANLLWEAAGLVAIVLAVFSTRERARAVEKAPAQETPARR